MITDEGRVKIMDFGLAKIRGGPQVTKFGTTLDTLAILPFANQSEDQEMEYLSDGIAETLINGKVQADRFRTYSKSISNFKVGSGVFFAGEAGMLGHIDMFKTFKLDHLDFTSYNNSAN